MKRIRITHSTEYHYHVPVQFGTHRLLVRPREGHELHIVRSKLSITPHANVRWLRDIYGNSVALLNFNESACKLGVVSEVDVDLYDDVPIDWAVDPAARSYPFAYHPTEQVEIIPYRLAAYPHDGPALQNWLSGLYVPGQAVLTADLLIGLNRRIHETFRYVRREEPGIQVPGRTLALGSGSCRDYAVFMMEAARQLGFAARFVTGYIQMGHGQHGATHAWTEIYLPGAGWRGFDPTNNKPTGTEHVSVGVAREHETACPLSGSWEGPADAWDRMEVSVQVVEL